MEFKLSVEFILLSSFHDKKKNNSVEDLNCDKCFHDSKKITQQKT